LATYARRCSKGPGAGFVANNARTTQAPSVVFRVQGRLPSYLDPAIVVMLTDGRPVVYQDGKPVPVRLRPAHQMTM